jgi:hypothetical protein
MRQSINRYNIVFKASDVWAQIDLALLDDVYQENSFENDQDSKLAQKIKSDILVIIGRENSSRIKIHIRKYTKYALMAAAVVILIGISWLFANILPLHRTSPTITANTYLPTQQTTKLNPTGATQTSPTTQATTASRVIVRSDKYADLSESKAPEQGQVLLSSGLQRAVDDPINNQSFFFIYIYILPAEQYENQSDDYSYNGRSISEWQVLVDLSNGTYPYNEYNGDHGGNVTREQWERAQAEAKKLDAQKNCDAARTEYRDKVWPNIVEAQTQATAEEIERLTQFGYDVFMYRTWSYAGPSKEKQDHFIMAGLVTKDQILHFPAVKRYGYIIDWVHNGDGVINWDDKEKNN